MVWTNPNNTQVTPLAVLGGPTGPVAGTIPTLGGAFNVTGQAPGAIQIAANGVYVLNVAQFASYDLNMYAYTQSAGSVGSNITVEITLQWYDELVTGIPVFEEDWWIWCARNSLPYGGGGTAYQNTLAGSGPMHGAYVAVYVSTATTAAFAATLKYFYLFGSNRPVPYSDWRQNAVAVEPNENGAVIQQGTGPIGFENILAQTPTALVIPAGPNFIPFGLYSGPINFYFEPSVIATTNPTIINVANMVSGNMADNGVGQGCMANLGNNAASAVSGVIYGPRAPCALMITGNAGGTTTFGFQAIAQQAA